METLATTVEGAAQALGIGRTTVYRLINEGNLKVVKIGRRTLVTSESIRALVPSSKLTAWPDEPPL